MAIAWGVAPPRKLCKSYIRLLAIRAGEKRPCCILGPTVGVQTHWDGGNTRICEGSHDCRFHDQPLTWKGYTPVVCWGWTHEYRAKEGWFQWVLIVSEELGEEAMQWQRGEMVMVTRPGTKKNGAMRCEKLSAAPPVDLPPSFPVMPYVLRAASATCNAKPVLRKYG